jgi:hypothetical protein
LVIASFPCGGTSFGPRLGPFILKAGETSVINVEENIFAPNVADLNYTISLKIAALSPSGKTLEVALPVAEAELKNPRARGTIDQDGYHSKPIRSAEHSGQFTGFVSVFSLPSLTSSLRLTGPCRE